MKAVRLGEADGLDSISIDEIPTPTTGPGKTLVKIKASAINHLELYLIEASSHGIERGVDHVPGSDASGVIESVGKGVSAYIPGDEVVINPNLGEPESDDFGILGLHRDGTHCDYIVVSVKNLAKKPTNVSFEEAAGLPLCLMTAWRQVVTKGAIRPGETVLIHGIGGAVALNCLQIAKMAGATVIVTSSDEGKLSKAKALGADHVLNYKHCELIDEVADITNGDGVNLVIDNIGSATIAQSMAVAAIQGRIVVGGNVSGGELGLAPSALYWKGLTISGSLMGTAEELDAALGAVESGAVMPVVDSVYPIEDYRLALERILAGKQFGKIVLSRS